MCRYIKVASEDCIGLLAVSCVRLDPLQMFLEEVGEERDAARRDLRDLYSLRVGAVR